MPLTGCGLRNRPMASQVIPPSTKSKSIALAIEAKIVTFRGYRLKPGHFFEPGHSFLMKELDI